MTSNPSDFSRPIYINGIARSKVVRAAHFTEKVTSGLPFNLGFVGIDAQSNVVANTGYNEELGYPDALMVPDLDTYVTIPWYKNTGRILLDATYEAKLFASHPRIVARKQLDRLMEIGFSFAGW